MKGGVIPQAGIYVGNCFHLFIPILYTLISREWGGSEKMKLVKLPHLTPVGDPKLNKTCYDGTVNAGNQLLLLVGTIIYKKNRLQVTKEVR